MKKILSVILASILGLTFAYAPNHITADIPTVSAESLYCRLDNSAYPFVALYESGRRDAHGNTEFCPSSGDFTCDPDGGTRITPPNSLAPYKGNVLVPQIRVKFVQWRVCDIEQGVGMWYRCEAKSIDGTNWYVAGGAWDYPGVPQYTTDPNGFAYTDKVYNPRTASPTVNLLDNGVRLYNSLSEMADDDHYGFVSLMNGRYRYIDLFADGSLKCITYPSPVKGDYSYWDRTYPYSVVRNVKFNG